MPLQSALTNKSPDAPYGSDNQGYRNSYRKQFPKEDASSSRIGECSEERILPDVFSIDDMVHDGTESGLLVFCGLEFEYWRLVGLIFIYDFYTSFFYCFCMCRRFSWHFLYEL